MDCLLGKRVLLVEDEPILAMSMEDIVAGFGCIVVGPALSIEEAEPLARGEALDAALLDINMGEGSSLSIAKILVERDVPFCFASGYGPAGVPTELRHLLVLQKPFTEHSLAEVLRRLLHR